MAEVRQVKKKRRRSKKENVRVIIRWFQGFPWWRTSICIFMIMWNLLFVRFVFAINVCKIQESTQRQYYCMDRITQMRRIFYGLHKLTDSLTCHRLDMVYGSGLPIFAIYLLWHTINSTIVIHIVNRTEYMNASNGFAYIQTQTKNTYRGRADLVSIILRVRWLDVKGNLFIINSTELEMCTHTPIIVAHMLKYLRRHLKFISVKCVRKTKYGTNLIHC